MKEDTERWIAYAEENVRAAEILKDNNLYNPCLHNIQQSVEKTLKALLIEKGLKLKKTHSINELKILLFQNNVIIALSDDDIELLDSIYLPSKYPLSSALPDFYPDKNICQTCIDIAHRVLEAAKKILF